MFLFLKKKAEESEVLEGAKARKEIVPLHDFVPYYCHYNPHTLLTKNGELLQIIKIAANNRGLNYESGEGTNNSIRENIRRAISEHVTNDNFSLWIHTLRRRAPVSYGGKFGEPFAAYMHDKWQSRSRWQYQYYNEIYVTILRDGQSTKLFDKHILKHVLIPKNNRKFRNGYLENVAQELENVTSAVLTSIRQHYNAQRLTVAERAPHEAGGASGAAFYSEPLEFLGTLINLRDQPYPLPEADLSTALCNHAITFGFNALETKNTNNQRRFGALLTLKQYQEVPSESIDRLLQFPMELAVSQAFHFVASNQALKQYKEQKELFNMSGDTYSVKASGLDTMLRSDQKRINDFGSHQTSFMIMVDEYKQLEIEIKKAQEAFAELGLITVREDIKLEECFWSQLPGNFEFLRRKDYLSTSKAAGFTRLNLYPHGKNTGNHWGDATVLIPTMVNSPYFFNFHHQDNGHTVLFDFNSFHDHAGSVLLNFLLTTSLKFQPRLFIFDRARSARLMFDKLDGQYHTFPAGRDTFAASGLALNPFSLEDNARNRGFLLAWCVSLIEATFKVTEEHKHTLQSAIAALYDSAAGERHMSGLIERIALQDAILARSFVHATASGKPTSVLGAQTENFDTSRTLHAFDMDPVIKTRAGATAIFSYLLHRIITTLDGTPTIIVLHEAWDLLENDFFAPRLESLLEMLKQNNAMVIFTTGTPSACVNTATLATVLQHCATRLYMPDDISYDYSQQPVGLTPHDSQMMGRMERQKGNFLLKQHFESIALTVNLDDMDDVRAIFANDIKNLIAAGGRFASLPQDG